MRIASLSGSGCYLLKHGKKPPERHHIAGKANSSVTVEVRANVHRAQLSAAQYEWPRRTLSNPDGSPLLDVAGAVRGAANFIEELIVQLMRLCAECSKSLMRGYKRSMGSGGKAARLTAGSRNNAKHNSNLQRP